ncbi:MAG: acyl-CoA dehydrogenase family protein, partial [Desulfuromonadales bacterium]|nr:acyl-CoA dehydrogenase family protein [Desulfuromonadales bacterium]
MLDSIDRFLERDVKPHAHELEARDEYPREIADKLAEVGLYGATISPEYGGLGLPAATYAKIVERISAVW